jgi:hypothetical protein
MRDYPGRAAARRAPGAASRARACTDQVGVHVSAQGFPHGMPTTQAETINADLLAFLND